MDTHLEKKKWKGPWLPVWFYTSSDLIVMCLECKKSLIFTIFFFILNYLSSFQAKIKIHDLVILIALWFCKKDSGL